MMPNKTQRLIADRSMYQSYVFDARKQRKRNAGVISSNLLNTAELRSKPPKLTKRDFSRVLSRSRSYLNSRNDFLCRDQPKREWI